MKQISQNSFLRNLLLPIFSKINLGDITIHHHWTDDEFLLHSFKHKGYWYHGKKREMETMMLFSRLIRKGDFLVEIGGHIGYLSLYFAQLIGPEGNLIVFEPGSNNLPYLLKNTKSKSNISIVEKAVTDFVGIAKFYVENLSGQNNSLLENYEYLKKNEEAANCKFESSIIEVPCTSLDEFIIQSQLPSPSFIKIDVEGAELQVLKGMKHILEKNGIALMVEVTENVTDVFQLLSNTGFQLFRPNKSPVNNIKDMNGNIFCVKGNDPRIRLFSS